MEQVVARLACGSYFGELGLLTNQARNATVRAGFGGDLHAWSFEAMPFHSMIADHVLLFRLQRERKRLAKQESSRARLRVGELDVLRDMPARELDEVLDSAENRWCPAGAEIFEQGDLGDRFYILLDGEVEVIRDGTVIATLGPGSFFGETALLLNTQRTATIRAATHALTWSITRSAFQRVVGHYLIANRATSATVMQRMRSILMPHQPELG
jgi:CRP-like cAMP-binding protein